MIVEQALALAQGFADQAQFAVLEVAEAAVNDASGATGGSGGEIVLFNQQHRAMGAGTFARDGDAIDAAADDEHLKVLAVKRGASLRGSSHPIDWMHFRPRPAESFCSF